MTLSGAAFERDSGMPFATGPGVGTTDQKGLRNVIVGGVLIIVLVASISLAINHFVDRAEMNRIISELHAFGHHWWAPVVLIAAFVVINLTGLPGTPLTLAAGAIWGWLLGGWWVIVATMIGTAVPYYVARHGAPRIRKILEQRFGGVYEKIRNEGMTAILLLRVVHIFPFAVISYGSGFARVRPWHYFVGTFLGTLPGIIIYTYLADAILDGVMSPRQATGRILFAGALVAIMVIGARLIAKRAGVDPPGSD